MKYDLWTFLKEYPAPSLVIITSLFPLILGIGGVIPIKPYPSIAIGRQNILIAIGVILLIVGVILLIRDIKKIPGSKVSMYLRHRITANRFYEDAFSSGKEVWYLSIMSQATVKEIEPKLQKAKAHNTRLRVLTFDPDASPETIEAIRSHLQENNSDPSKTAIQIKDAWNQWTYYANKYPNVVEVRKYKSIPTLQIIVVGDEYAKVELLPYNTPPNDRPGLVITSNTNPELFQILKNKCMNLWDASVQS